MKIGTAARIRGSFHLPGDKSLSHRMALFGAIAHGTTRITNFGSAADNASTLACLEALGVAVQRNGSTVEVEGHGPEGLRAPAGVLDCGNSGSTLRMLSGIVAGRPFRSVLTGDASLCRRPVERIAVPLRQMGARAESEGGKPPLVIEGGGLHAIRYEQKVASAQVKTAVLLAGLQAEGRTTVTEPELSRDHTERLLPAFGVPVAREGLAVSVEGGAQLRATTFDVPGDASSAAFLLVAALVLPDSEVTIDNVLLNPTRTAFLDVLREMGADIAITASGSGPEPIGVVTARSSRLRGTTVAPQVVPALIDEVPILAVAAAHAEGTFTLTGAAELRVKESDRLSALAEGLTSMGVSLDELPDGLVVRGGRPLKGAAVRAHDDHRIAMSLAVAALTATGVTEIEGAECASVSFPEFYGLLARGTGRG
ncbi:MAG TPA: 3-phosphoshikimate 1-carboxyvinyltransferase [Vicinamibacteria bacterium]|nr:3-phosphoshikimate 1-carboxyvinyltransferase [Vicinamibacteria bacterium]